jgi:hypothetical protein
MSADAARAEQATDQTTGQATDETAGQTAYDTADQPVEQPTEPPDGKSEPVALAAEGRVPEGPPPDVDSEAETPPGGSDGPVPSDMTDSETPADVADGPTPSDDDDRSREPLVPEPFGYQSRWDGIQAGFVDEPRRSVAEADALVAEVIDEITDAFAGARAALEAQWSEGGEASTEDLRQAFRRYRSFFQRLLTT